ncbi:shikimate kinase [Acetobacterium carbinolicum]|jgi:shikimate kinase|uniref:shikimate kinase n=1 Tax=Acetobacterium TaxID=33951 RepID=UPI000DBEB78B|nr:MULTISPECIES: shikimate kinase [unclassified Acetobacterium]AWW26610.1 shikimate kinase [Acetobacterium sp. KB-1]MDK2943041.1 shikimate kinase [Acetobacterium sp.]MDZ5725273.1 shikimate kinase [Acetobacterium sp. K1/6]
MNSKKKSIALIGFMATGKSTLGPMLARELEYDFIDTDAMVVANMGIEIAEIFSQFGEDTFRDAEHEALKKALSMEHRVISTGGGIILFKRNRKLLSEQAFVVSLSAQPETIYGRVKDDNTRPLLRCEDPLLRIRQLLAERQAYYDVCDFKISTETWSTEECCQRIEKAYYLKND